MNVLPQTSYATQVNRWYNESDPNHDFLARLAGPSVFWRIDGRVDDLDSMYSRSSGTRSSIPVHVRSEISASSAASTTATREIPRLTRGPSMVSSIGSPDTSAASALDGGYVLSIREDGLLTLPERAMLPNADLLCPFQILDCEDVFSDIREFKIHVFSHFRGHPAPTTAGCFLCDDMFHQTEHDHPALAWNNMLSHLAQDHYRQGQRLATVRTDFSLMRWMYSRRIISDAQFKRTQLCPLPTLLPNSVNEEPSASVNMPFAPMPPSASLPRALHPSGLTGVGDQSESFTVQAGRRAERRRRDATRVMQGRGNL